MYNLTEYSNSYSRTSGSLWEYYTDEPVSTVLVPLLIFMLLITVLCLNLGKKQQVKQLMVVQKIFK